MSITCAAVHCPCYKEDFCFRLYIFPLDPKLRQLWVERAFEDVNIEREHCEELFLCEIHFESDQFVEGDRKNCLNPTAIPTIFQHSTPHEYVINVCTILHDLGRKSNFTQQALQELLDARNIKGSAHKEALIKLGSFLVLMELQSKRLSKKTEILTEALIENQLLRHMHNEQIIFLKGMKNE